MSLPKGFSICVNVKHGSCDSVEAGQEPIHRGDDGICDLCAMYDCMRCDEKIEDNEYWVETPDDSVFDEVRVGDCCLRESDVVVEEVE